LSAQITVYYEVNGERRAGRLEKLTFNGVVIGTSQPPKVGSAIVLALAGKATFPATVRWLRPEGFGAHFGLLGARETFFLAQEVSLVTSRVRRQRRRGGRSAFGPGRPSSAQSSVPKSF
jgi:hypothetical protein